MQVEYLIGPWVWLLLGGTAGLIVFAAAARRLYRGRRKLCCSLALLGAAASAWPAGLGSFGSYFFLVIMAPPHPEEVLLVHFEEETGLRLPEGTTELQSFRSPCDWFGDWSGELVAFVPRHRLPDFLELREDRWTPEVRLERLHHDRQLDRLTVPAGALLAEGRCRAPGNCAKLLAVDPVASRIYFHRFSW